MDTLAQIYERHRVHGPDAGHGDKGGTHSYIPEYERLLAPYRDGWNCFLEIGLAMGLSLAMWREYLPDAEIYGVDLSIVFDPKPHTDTGTILIAADATKPEFLHYFSDIFRFDVVIDDGSHLTSDQVKTFNLLKPQMASGGIYIIEDILNLEASRAELENLHPKHEVIDLRHVKGRFDDVLVVYYF